MNLGRKDLGSGAFFIGAGAGYLIYALKTLPIGQALNMGPGYFPVILSGLLIFFGAILVIRSFVLRSSSLLGAIPWRAGVMLIVAIAFFATFLDQIGMLPAVFMTSLLAGFASRKIKVVNALIVSSGIAAFCVLVFNYGIGLPVRVFGSWFGM